MAAPRFSPPPVACTPELAWVLARAFGPPREASPGLRAGDALRLARGLAMCGRIAARTRAETLVAELGAEGASELRADHVLAVGQEMRLAELTREVASVAAAIVGPEVGASGAAATGVPLVLLKFAALRHVCELLPGERDAGDLDVLVEERQAEALALELERRGFRRSPLPGWDHQLPALVHPSLGMLEIHVHIPGVRPPDRRGDPARSGNHGCRGDHERGVLRRRGGRFARFEDLAWPGRMTRVTALPGNVFVPSLEILAAHALAHGIVQHGRAPASYPLLRMLADLTRLPVEAEAVAGWLAGVVPLDEVRGTLELVRDLSLGIVDLDRLDRGRPGEALLLHILAGTLDATYRDSLTLGRVLDPLSERGRLAGLVAGLARALFPSRAELGLLYPELVARRGLLAARVYRPVDLVRRAVRGRSPALAVGLP